MSDSHANDHEHHGVGHIAPLRALLGTGIALLFLTWITVAIAEVDLGRANIYVALTVAVVKGSLVALYFMHLRWDRPFNAIVFIGSLTFVALFLAFAMVDTAEYQTDLIAGDAEKVVQTIAEQQQ